MRRRKRINETSLDLADIAIDAAAGIAADKAVDSVLDDKEEEDAEEMTPGTATPTGSNTPTPPAAIPASPEDKEENEPDPLVDQVIKLVQQYKDKQVSDAQMDYAYRQDQANKIVSDIEEFIKNNTKK